MASSARIDEIKKKFDENPRRYFAPLANEFRKAGDLDQAIMICEEFLPQQAGHMSGHIVYGQALYESGRLTESRTVFETALALDPENLIALRHLGDIARSDGSLEEARRWYDRVLESDPRNDEIQGLIASLDQPAGSSVSAEPAQDWLQETAAVEPDMATSPSPTPPPLPVDLAPIDLDMDEAIFGAPPAPAPEVKPNPAPALDDSFSLAGLERSDDTQPEEPVAADAYRSDGIEFGEFEAPRTPVTRAEGLEAAEFERPVELSTRAEGLESSEFEAPGVTEGSLLDIETSFERSGGSPSDDGIEWSVSPLPLDSSMDRSPDASLEREVELIPLDVDSGELTSPHGDAILALSPELAQDSDGASSDDHARMAPPAAMEAMPALLMDDEGMSLEMDVAAPPRMLELPPEVIAAEAALMDFATAGEVEPAPEPARAPRPDTPPASPALFVTETMAELYLKQGFREQAAGVYRQLAAAAPDDARLRARLAELEASPTASPASGPTVREFLSRIARRRAGESGMASAPPSNDDFASFEPIPEPSPEPAPAPAPAATPAAARDTESKAEVGSRDGTIDALFGNRPVGSTEDSAAAALAQAFSGSEDAPILAGRPARAAAGELSLDSVFRDGPPRPPRVSQSFAFDQFFSDTASADAGTPAPPATEATSGGEPAERGADDISQFNSWLQGLKQK